MNEQHIKNAPSMTMRNRNAVEESEVCGCYYCLSVFSKHDIVDWTDNSQTAICPKCNVDSVLAQSHGISLEQDVLQKIHDYWFK
jgi:hypothetical protein